MTGVVQKREIKIPNPTQMRIGDLVGHHNRDRSLRMMELKGTHRLLWDITKVDYLLPPPVVVRSKRGGCYANISDRLFTPSVSCFAKDFASYSTRV